MGNLTDAKVKEGIKVDPSNIMQVGMGFWASKTLLTAVKLELFTFLAAKPLTGAEIKRELCLNGRGMYDFLDALVAMGFLNMACMMHPAAPREKPTRNATINRGIRPSQTMADSTANVASSKLPSNP